MSLLKSGDVGVHVNNAVVNITIIGQDVRELAVNMEKMHSRKTEHIACTCVFVILAVFMSNLHNFSSKLGATFLRGKEKGNAEKTLFI